MYITNTGKKFWISGEKELVEALQTSSFSPTHTIQKFMYEVKNRVKLQTGESIRIDSPVHFVMDLVELGLLTKIQPN